MIVADPDIICRLSIRHPPADPLFGAYEINLSLAAIVYVGPPLLLPFLEDRVRPIQQMRNGKAGRDLAGKVHQELKRIGGIRPPREFVLMDRAAVGLGSVFMHLGAEVNWHELFHDLIDDFSIENLARRQRKAVETIGLPAGLIASSL